MAYLSKKFLNERFANRALFESRRVLDSYDTIKGGQKLFDVFLSYSYPDKEYALKIYYLMIDAGYKVYIDIKDKSLHREDVDKETAERIALIMNRCKSLVYIHTKSATTSKWCPWELGYMSGKSNFRCAVIPLVEDKEDFPRQEFLELYPYVDYVRDEKGKDEFWVNERGTKKYVSLRSFVNGKNPENH